MVCVQKELYYATFEVITAVFVRIQVLQNLSDVSKCKVKQFKMKTSPFDSEGVTVILSIRNCTPNYTLSHPRRPELSNSKYRVAHELSYY